MGEVSPGSLSPQGCLGGLRGQRRQHPPQPLLLERVTEGELQTLANIDRNQGRGETFRHMSVREEKIL